MDVAETTDDVHEKPVSVSVVRVPVKHTNLGIRSHAMDMSTMVELTSFSSLGKIQPFLVTVSTTASLVVDLHCHLTNKEVCGYLGGHWDINAHNLAITHAFPCRYTGKDKTLAGTVEADIARVMEWKQLTLVGWYHSHPRNHASPSLRDVDSQLDYQIKMKGLSDNSYTPCVGLICSPYNTDNSCFESNFNIFWSLPPPENRPHEYPRPMLLSYSLSQEQFLSQDAIEEINKCVEFYKNEDSIDFSAIFNGNITYLEKLRSSLMSKLPRNQSNGSYWDLIRGIVSPGTEDPASTQPSAMITSSDLYSAVKFPLVPDTSGQSSLNPNNLFLTPANFKLDSSVSILKPFNVPSTSKDNKNDGSSIIKSQKFELPIPDLNVNSKHKISSEFTSGELTVSIKNSKSDYDFCTADFSKVTNLLSSDSSANKGRSSDFTLADISQLSKFSDLSKIANFSTSDLTKLSGFSINDITKTSPAYTCNLANLFTPISSKVGKDLTVSDVNKMNEYPATDFLSSDITFKASDVNTNLKSLSSDSKLAGEFSGEQKKSDSTEPLKTRTDYSMDELSISNVKPDFGAMLDMKIHGKVGNQNSECSDSLNLSKDHQ